MPNPFFTFVKNYVDSYNCKHKTQIKYKESLSNDTIKALYYDTQKPTTNCINKVSPPTKRKYTKKVNKKEEEKINKVVEKLVKKPRKPRKVKLTPKQTLQIMETIKEQEENEQSNLTINEIFKLNEPTIKYSKSGVTTLKIPPKLKPMIYLNTPSEEFFKMKQKPLDVEHFILPKHGITTRKIGVTTKKIINPKNEYIKKEMYNPNQLEYIETAEPKYIFSEDVLNQYMKQKEFDYYNYQNLMNQKIYNSYYKYANEQDNNNNTLNPYYQNYQNKNTSIIESNINNMLSTRKKFGRRPGAKVIFIKGRKKGLTVYPGDEGYPCN